MIEGKNTFCKAERLTGVTRIDEMYRKGKSFVHYPYRVVYERVERGEFPVALLISVPKKRFRHAVDRNRIKRQTREAYRHAKPEFYAALSARDLSLCMALNYISDEKFPSAELAKKLDEITKKILQRLE